MLNLDDDERTDYRLNKMGYIFQNTRLSLNSRSLRTCADRYGKGISDERAAGQASRFSLPSDFQRGSTISKRLSGGEQQRWQLPGAW